MAGVSFAPYGGEPVQWIRSKAPFIGASGFLEKRMQLQNRIGPIYPHIRVVVHHMPEEAIAVIGIALGVQDVGMPHQVDKSIRDERDVGACQMESQELPVLPFGEIDLCCVQTSAFLRVQKFLLHAAEVEFGDRAWDGHFAFSKWGATATLRRTFRLIWNDRT